MNSTSKAFDRYVDYWRPKFRGVDPKTYCFVMEVETESGNRDEYYMLAHELPEDKSLREKLQRERLVLDEYFWLSYPSLISSYSTFRI